MGNKVGGGGGGNNKIKNLYILLLFVRSCFLWYMVVLCYFILM